MKRFGVVPFEAVFGVLALASGALGLLHLVASTDPLSDLIGNWMIAFQVIYVLSGVLMLAGIGFGHREVEAPGVVLFAVSIIVRTLALVWFLHLSSVVWISLIFNSVIVWACWVRARSLTRGESLARMDGDT